MGRFTAMGRKKEVSKDRRVAAKDSKDSAGHALQWGNSQRNCPKGGKGANAVESDQMQDTSGQQAQVTTQAGDTNVVGRAPFSGFVISHFERDCNMIEASRGPAGTGGRGRTLTAVRPE